MDDRNVILVSDHADSCILLETLLRTRLGCKVIIASDLTVALRLAEDPDVKLIVGDFQSPKDEIHFIHMLNAQNVEQPTIFYSNDPPGPNSLTRIGIIVEFVKKPQTKELIKLIGETFGWPISGV